MTCTYCGTENPAGRRECLNCGEKLTKQDELVTSALIDKLADRADELTPSGLERIVKWIFFALAPVCFALCTAWGEIILGFLSAAFATVAGFAAGFPSGLWELNKLRLSLFAHVDGATPTMLWSISRKISYWLFAACAIAVAVVTAFA